MRQPAPIFDSGEDRPEPAEAATEVGAEDEFDRSFAFVSGVCMAAVAVMAALAILWPA